jgi:hypothetical protein
MSFEMIESNQKPTTLFRRWSTGAAVALAMAVAVGGCDRLLEVNLPSTVTDAAFGPGTSDVSVNSIIALFECSYSGFAIAAAGEEDNFQRVTGVAGLYSEYPSTPAGGCSGDNYSYGWSSGIMLGRGLGYKTYNTIENYSSDEIAAAGGLGAYKNKDELLATAALYTALILDQAGEHYCEFVVSSETELGALMTNSQTLDLAEQWADTALGHIAATGDFGLTLANGTITSSMDKLAHGIRARIRWANGDLSGAADDAALVPDDFFAYVLREDGVETQRINMVGSMQGGAGGVQAAGFVQGPVRLKDSSHDVPYGVTVLGNKPNGQPWPNPVPFTGYRDLAIDQATGRAVDANGYPLTTATAGTVADNRIQTQIGNTAGGPDVIVAKYPSFGDDIPLLNWMEMRLIQAEADKGSAVTMVNKVRHGMAYVSGETLVQLNLPNVTYNPTGTAIDDMIIEERRRALWLEGRFWSTKILNPNKLWFPRNNGQWLNKDATYNLGGGVRVLLPGNEYELNLGLEARGTGCPADQAPVFT